MAEAKSPTFEVDEEEDDIGGLVVHETPTKGKGKRPRGNVRRMGNLSGSVGDEQAGDIISDNLTMTNVKSIIYNVVKDADVQKMLSNTLQQDDSKLQAATYEPKMTRAKMKQVLAKEGNIPYPWPRSPRRLSKKKKKHNFTDLEFPEDDDDEDYNLEKALAELADGSSDEDTESVLSSHTSDVGSPMNSSAWSPQVSNSPSLTVPTISARHDNLPQICMGPPPPPVSTSHESEKMFLDALDKLDLTDTIAKRTRSQLPLTDTPISTLEAEFIAPDVTVDMYDDSEVDDDPEWKDFLQDLLRDDVPVEDDDDPEADPEYNVLAEPDAETEDDHVLPVRVYKSEINQLMDELNEWPTPDEDDNSQDMPSTFNKPKPLPISKLTSVSELLEMKKANERDEPTIRTTENSYKVRMPSLPTLNVEQRLQLRRQMESHVQILCQQAVLAQVAAPHLYTQSTHLLTEISVFASSSKVGVNSAFNAINLPQALHLVSNYTEEEVAEETDPLTLTSQQKSTFAFSPVFMYPKLLPSHGFNADCRMGRVKFRHAEDVLICMGIEEFKSCPKSTYELIHKYLVPVHTVKSIKLHVQNECKKDKVNKTTIGRYKSQGLIPGSVHLSRILNTELMVAPMHRPYHLSYPNWLKTMPDMYVPRKVAATAQSKASAPDTAAEAVENNSVVTVTHAASSLAGATTIKKPDSLGLHQENDSTQTAKTDVSTSPTTVSSDVLENQTSNNDVSSNLISDNDVPENSTANNDVIASPNANNDVLASPADSNDLSTSSPANTDVSIAQTVTTDTSDSHSTNVDVDTSSMCNNDLSTAGLCHIDVSSANTMISTPSPPYNKLSRSPLSTTDAQSLSAHHARVAEMQPGSVLMKQEYVEGPCMLTILAGLSEAYAKQPCEDSHPGADIVTPTKDSDTRTASPGKTPYKRWRGIAPSHLRTPEKQYSPIDPNWKMRRCSPRRKELRTKVQSIVPKSFIPTVYIPSPTKKAAKAISDKALSRASHISKYKSPLKRSPLKRTVSSYTEPDTDEPATDDVSLPAASTVKRLRTKPSIQVLAGDDMFPSLIESSESRTARKNHYHLASLSTDIIEKDPQRVEREEKFSRWYIDKVKDTLGEDSEEYNAFLEALINFGNQKKNPAVFYRELRDTVLKDQQDLLQGFSAFLLPAQALACGEKCYRDCMQYNRARRFMRRIEVYFGARSKLFVKLMKLLRACDVTEPKDELRNVISSLLKRHTTLLEEFNAFFPDASPPKRHEEDYEEMDLTKYDEKTVMDGFEEMELPEMEVTNATPKCKCDCHEDATRQKGYHLRKKHCEDCMVAVWHSTLCIHEPSHGLRPAYFRYLNNKRVETVTATISDDDSKYSDVECTSPTAVSPEAKPCSIQSNEVDPTVCRQPEVLATADYINRSITPDPWSRDEDRLILEAMQRSDSMSLSDDALYSLSTNLQNRSALEIRHRFDTLLQLLSQELGSEDSDSNR